MIILKFFHTLLAGTLIISMFAGCTPKEEEPEVIPQIVLTPEYTEMEVPAKVTIRYEIVPEDLTGSVKITGIKNSGVYIRRKDDKLFFQTDKAGDYLVQLEGEYTNEEGETFDLTSNNAEIYVKEPPKKETEKPKEEENKNEETPPSQNEENNETSQTPSDSTVEEPEEIFIQPISVDDAIANGEAIISSQKEITIEGLLPQAMVEVADGSMQPVIWNNNSTQYIILDNADVLDIGSTRAQLMGVLSYKDGEYHFTIRKFRQLNS